MERRRVCHLTDVNLRTNFFSSIGRLHDPHRYPVLIACLASPGTLQESMAELGVPSFALQADSRLRYPQAVLKLARILKAEHVALLHAHCFDPTTVGLLAARWAGIPFIFTRHHSDHHVRIGKRWHTRVDAFCARRADQVIAVSEATRRVMTEVEGVPDAKIRVIYNGMEPMREPAPGEVARVRDELGLRDEHVCLVPARLHEEKGHRYLFAAAPEIIRRVGPTAFLLAGEGPHRAELEREARTSGLGGIVRFLGRRSDMAALITLASIVVLPSLAESFGFVLLEAMSLGRPVVASDAGGIPEVVEHGVTGVIVPRAEATALADAVASLLDDPARARRLGDAGRERGARFGFASMIHGYEALYDEIIGRRDG